MIHFGFDTSAFLVHQLQFVAVRDHGLDEIDFPDTAAASQSHSDRRPPSVPLENCSADLYRLTPCQESTATEPHEPRIELE